MIKQLLNSVIAKYRYLSVSLRSIICLRLRLRQDWSARFWQIRISLNLVQTQSRAMGNTADPSKGSTFFPRCRSRWWILHMLVSSFLRSNIQTHTVYCSKDLLFMKAVILGCSENAQCRVRSAESKQKLKEKKRNLKTK